MNVFIVREGKFYTGGWKLNTDFAFANKEDLHEHMENLNGFKCLPSDDQYSKEGTRFTNGNEKYGYDIVELNVFGTDEAVSPKIEVKIEEQVPTIQEVLEPSIVQVTGLQDESLRLMAKDEGVKSWHLKSRDTLIKEVSEKLMKKGFKVE